MNELNVSVIPHTVLSKTSSFSLGHSSIAFMHSRFFKQDFGTDC